MLLFSCVRCSPDLLRTFPPSSPFPQQTQKDAKRRVSKAKLQDFVDDVSLYAKEDTLLLMCDDEKFETFLKGETTDKSPR